KKVDTREKPEDLVGDSRGRRKRGFKYHTSDLTAGCQASGDRSAEELPEGNDRFGVGASCVHKVFVGRFGITVDTSLARLPFAVTVTAIFQSQYVCMCAAEKFVDGCTVGNVGGVPMKGKKREFRLVSRNPPRVELDAVR